MSRARRLRTAALAVAAVTAVAVAGVTTGEPGGRHASAAGYSPRHFGPPFSLIETASSSQPPTTRYCRKNYHTSCYSPAQFAVAYNTKPLYAQGVDGRGVTIAVIDPIGSPTIAHDLQVFDQTYRLPDPDLRILQPEGKPPWDPNNPYDTGWAFETSLDVEYVHAMAPRAKILLVEGTVEEEQSTSGFPEMAAAEQYVADHHLASVMNLSQGATEDTFPNERALLEQRYGFEAAARAGISMFASSGDWYTTNLTTDLVDYWNRRTVNWPSSDPLITAVGGTAVNLNLDGARVGPDVGWNPSGGGVSRYFSRPSYEHGVRSVVGDRRGLPDISMDASGSSGAIVFSSIGGSPRWSVVGGTSLSAPLMSGIVGLAVQEAGHNVGNINEFLYGTAARNPAAAGLMDITVGNNSNPSNGVTGYSAGPGYDLVSGWGTIGDAARFVPALAHAAVWHHH